MCFTKTESGQKHQLSDVDITCYKVMWHERGHLYPYFYMDFDHLYKIGDVMEPKLKIAMSTLDKLSVFCSGVIHSFTTPDTSKSSLLKSIYDTMGTVLVRCIIPAGTPYWVNDDEDEHEFASLKVKIEKILW